MMVIIAGIAALAARAIGWFMGRKHSASHVARAEEQPRLAQERVQGLLQRIAALETSLAGERDRSLDVGRQAQSTALELSAARNIIQEYDRCLEGALR